MKCYIRENYKKAFGRSFYLFSFPDTTRKFRVAFLLLFIFQRVYIQVPIDLDRFHLSLPTVLYIALRRARTACLVDKQQCSSGK